MDADEKKMVKAKTKLKPALKTAIIHTKDTNPEIIDCTERIMVK